MLAALVLPGWVAWRIRSECVSLPLAGVLTCWFFLIASWLPHELEPDYDGIGFAFTLLFGPGIGTAVILGVSAIRRKREVSGQGATRFEGGNVVAGLLAWTSLELFCVTSPWAVPPRMLDGFQPVLGDYFFYLGPVTLLATAMSLLYILDLRRILRADSRARK